MAQTQALITALKRSLKAHAKTYVDVAEVLDLTEASVKRLFSENSFSLSRLDKICLMLGIEISDLVKLMEQQSNQILQLNHEQELEIANDTGLLFVTVCVLNRWNMAQIMQYYHIDEVTCLGKLLHLNKLKVIELLPKNNIKLLVSPNFKWLENGPIQQFFQEKMAREFFNSRFTRDTEELIVVNGMLSDASNKVFQRKMKHLAKEFETLNQEDIHLGFEQRHGYTGIIAIRGWKYGLFSPLTIQE